MLEIYHNPRCGKSRSCLAFVEALNLPYKTNLYLQESPTALQINGLLKKLDIAALDLVRKKEKIWIENYKQRVLSEDEIVQAMVDFPILIERPIVVFGDKAIIGRDTEKLKEFLK